MTTTIFGGSVVTLGKVALIGHVPPLAGGIGGFLVGKWAWNRWRQ